MSRPSQHLDKVLIEVAKDMMRESGVSGISIRQVCSRAKVNLGMFKYHFENRAAFLRIVHDQLYDEFFMSLQQAAREQTRSIDKLRSCLLTMCQVCKKERSLVASLIRDYMTGSLEEIMPQEEMIPKDLLLILELIGECKKDGFLTNRIADFQIVFILVPSLIVPILAERDLREFSHHFPQTVPLDVSSESACLERLDILLKGLVT